MTNFIQPFDFRTIFVNYFLGGTTLFLFALVIILSSVAAKFQMSNRVFLILLMISSLIFGAYLGEGIYILIFLILGFITFKTIARLVN